MYQFRDFSWLSSFGGLATSLGVLLVYYHSLPENKKREKPPESKLATAGDEIVLRDDGGHASVFSNPKLADDLAKEEREAKLKHQEYLHEQKKDLFNAVIITVAGTILWAYGSYFNLIFFVKC